MEINEQHATPPPLREDAPWDALFLIEGEWTFQEMLAWHYRCFCFPREVGPILNFKQEVNDEPNIEK